MQRLYDLHQLGLTDRVFIDASHSRLHHVVGVVEQVTRVMRTIATNLKAHPERILYVGAGTQEVTASDFAHYVESREREGRLVGLLHDLTHAPYGHTLEDEIRLVRDRHDDPDRQADAFYRLLIQLLHGLLLDIGVLLPVGTRGAATLRLEDAIGAEDAGRLGAYMLSPDLADPPGLDPETDRAFIDRFAALIRQLLNDDRLLAPSRVARGPHGSEWLIFLAQLRFSMRALLHLELLHSSAPEPKHLPHRDGNHLYAFECLIDAVLSGAPTDEVQRVATFDPPRDAFILDVVGNTICADLLDYARRDSVNAGLRLDYDADRIVENMTLLSYQDPHRQWNHEGSDPFESWIVRTGIGMFSHKLRIDVPGELLNLLQVRFYVYQRALFHPTKCIAGAMLGSALQLIGWHSLPSHLRHVGDAVFLREIRDAAMLARQAIEAEVRGGLDPNAALSSEIVTSIRARLARASGAPAWSSADRVFADQLSCMAVHAVSARDLTSVSHSAECSPAAATRQTVSEFRADLDAAAGLLARLATRRYFSPVFRLLPDVHVQNNTLNHKKVADIFLDPRNRWRAEREIEKRANLARGSVVIHCPVAEGPRKIANILMVWRDSTGKEDARPLRQLGHLHPKELFEDHQNAVLSLEQMYASMWRLVVSVPMAVRFEAIEHVCKDPTSDEHSELEDCISQVIHDILIKDGRPTRISNERTMRDELLHAGRRLRSAEEAAERTDHGLAFDERALQFLYEKFPAMQSARMRFAARPAGPVVRGGGSPMEEIDRVIAAEWAAGHSEDDSRSSEVLEPREPKATRKGRKAKTGDEESLLG